MSKIKQDIGQGGAHINTDLKQHLVDIVDSLNSVKAQVDELQAAYEAHRQNTTSHASADTTNTSTTNSEITITK